MFCLCLGLRVDLGMTKIRLGQVYLWHDCGMLRVCLGYGWGITRVCLWYGKAKGMFWLLMLKGIFRDLYPLSKEYCIHKKDPILNQCAIVLKGLCARFNQILHPFQCRRFFQTCSSRKTIPSPEKGTAYTRNRVL